MDKHTLTLYQELTPGIWGVYDGRETNVIHVKETIKTVAGVFAVWLMDSFTAELPPNVRLAKMPEDFGREVLIHDDSGYGAIGAAGMGKFQLSGAHGQYLYVGGNCKTKVAYVVEPTDSQP